MYDLVRKEIKNNLVFEVLLILSYTCGWLFEGGGTEFRRLCMLCSWARRYRH